MNALCAHDHGDSTQPTLYSHTYVRVQDLCRRRKRGDKWTKHNKKKRESPSCAHCGNRCPEICIECYFVLWFPKLFPGVCKDCQEAHEENYYEAHPHRSLRALKAGGALPSHGEAPPGEKAPPGESSEEEASDEDGHSSDEETAGKDVPSSDKGNSSEGDDGSEDADAEGSEDHAGARNTGGRGRGGGSAVGGRGRGGRGRGGRATARAGAAGADVSGSGAVDVRRSRRMADADEGTTAASQAGSSETGKRRK